MTVTRGLPRRTEGVRRVADAGRLLLLDDADGEVCVLNETAAAIWELCDGRTSLEEMVEAVCTVCAVDEEQATRDIHRALEELTRIGVVEWEATR